MKRNEWRFLPGHLRHRRATFFGAMIFLLGLFSVLGTGCQDAMDEEETRVLRQATEHDPHYDFQEDYEPGYCGSFTALGDGPQQVASIDSHGQLFTPERRRPSWSDISEGRHYLDSESTVGYDAEGERIIEPNTAQRIPDYRMVSNNFKLLNSLTLLLSSLTKVTDTINDIDENGFGDLVAEFANDSICQAYGNEVGHCICTTPGSQLPCGGDGGFSDGADLLDSVGDAFNGLPAAAGQAFETVTQDFINSLLNGTPNHTPGVRQAILYILSLTGVSVDPDLFPNAPDWLDVSLDPTSLGDYNGIIFPDGATLTGPPAPMYDQVQDEALEWLDELQDSIDAMVSAYEDAFSAGNPNFICTDADDALTAFNASKGALDGQLANLPGTLTAAYQAAITAWQDGADAVVALWNDLAELWSSVKDLWNVVFAAENTDGIFQVQWSDFKDGLQDIKASANAISNHIQTIQDIIATMNGLMDDLKDAADELQSLAAVALGDAESLAEALGECADTLGGFTIVNTQCGSFTLPQLQGIPDVEAATADLCSYLWFDLDKENSLAGRIYNVLEREWERIVYLFEQTWNGITSHFSGDGVATLVDQLMDQLITEFFGATLDSVLMECHARDTRCGCNEFCAASGQETYMWLPVDYAKNPASAAGAVGHFALEQTGFLDTIVATLSSLLDSYLGDAVSWAADAMGGLTEVVERVLKFFSDMFRYIDHFTSGYHIGAYSDLRPDLHMCVSFAGHSTYAALGKATPEKKFSLGARYGHHQLSAKHRVRFGSGGFAVQFKDKQLSLAPSIGLYKHIDGFRLWSQLSPLGLKIGEPSFSGSLSEIYANADSFHLASPEDGVDGGQAFMNAFNANGLGSALVRDLYPVQPAFGTVPSIPRPPGMGVWPRLPPTGYAFSGPQPEMSAPPWNDTTPTWEQESDAVASLGLNLAVDFGEYEWSLPEIPVFSTGFFEATLRIFIRLAAGIGWWHDTDLFLERIRTMVNSNLPEGFDGPTLNYPEDFKRDMHAMQAPDVTAENGSYVYAQPTIGAELSAKATFRIIELALRLGLSLGIKIEPGASGGIMDLNASLAKTLQHSNPPEEAECSPVISERYASFCTASRFDSCLDNSGCPDGSSCVSIPGSDARVCSPKCSDSMPCPYGNCRYDLDSWHSATEKYPVSGGVCEVLESVTYTDKFETTSCNPVHAGGSCGVSFFYEDGMDKPVLFCADNWLYIDEMDCEMLGAYVAEYESGLISLEQLINTLSEYDQLEFITSTLQGFLGLATTAPDPTPDCVLVDGTVLEDYVGACCLENGTCTADTYGSCCTPGPAAHDICQDVDAQSCDITIKTAKSGVFRPHNKCSELGNNCMSMSVPRFSIEVYSATEPCGERNDAFDDTPYTTAYFDVGTLPTCDLRGMCVVEHGSSGRILQVIHGMTPGECDNPDNHNFFYGLPDDVVRTYTSYACVTHAVVDDSVVTGWVGDGCHPLQHGFPSACGCTSDAGCMPGEKCLFGTHEPSGDPLPMGQCVMADSQETFSCAADSQDDCPNGRIFVEGSCLVPCHGPDTCDGTRVCDEDTMTCRPPHGIDYAESVSWGMDNVTAPMHSIWTYSMADYMQLLLFGLTFKIDLSLPWPRKPIVLLDVGKTWDLNSTWKGWLQPGLQAHYQHECALAADMAIAGGDDAHLYDVLLSPMTNYQPYRGTDMIGTINPDEALDPDGLTGDLRCMGPNSGGSGVCRYRGDLSPTTSLGAPSTIPMGNTNRSVGEFLDWCKQILPDQAEFDAQPQSPDNFLESIADMLNWSYDLGIDLFQETNVCLGDTPIEEFLGDFFDADGDPSESYTFTNETTGEVTEVTGVPNFATMDCEYVGQHTDKCPNGICTFPCGELMDYASEIWGCSDLDPDYWLHNMILHLENENQNIVALMSNAGWANASFPGSEGLPPATTQMINPNNPTIMRPSLIDPSKKVLDFNAIFHRGELGAYPLSLADMIGTFRDLDYDLLFPQHVFNQGQEWVHQPPIRAHNIGRLWHMDFTACMDAAAADIGEFGCTCTSHDDCGAVEPGSYCEFDNGPAPGVGVCWKNQPTRLGDSCFDGSGDECEVVCTTTGEPPAEGEDCPDYFYYPECSPFKLVLDGEIQLCEDDDNTDPGTDPEPEKGACCVDSGETICFETESDVCSNRGGSFHAGLGCPSINYCKEDLPTGSCCLNDGTCLEDVLQETCEDRRGQFTEDGTCTRRSCMPRMSRDETVITPSTGVINPGKGDEKPGDCGGCSASGMPTDDTILLAIFLGLIAVGRRQLRQRRQKEGNQN